MKKILFLIHDLCPGGAERVLVNLVNHLDPEKFDVTVMTLFDVGILRDSLSENVRYIGGLRWMFPGNSHLMKLFPPKILHRMYVKENYDIEVAYLEGPVSRVISGCDSGARTVSWIHGEMPDRSVAASSFRSTKEADDCYNCFDKMVYVSKTVRANFESLINLRREGMVLYNTIESKKIRELSSESAEEICDTSDFRLVAVGTLKKIKAFDRLLHIVKRLVTECRSLHLYLIGAGPLENDFIRYIKDNSLQSYITLLGFQENPYKYVAKCDLFVCSSISEGFSTAATEALIVGTPVCTVDVSGMKEMLGENNEFGLITENSEEALYSGIKNLLDSPELLEHYKKQAEIRGKEFSTEKTVQAVEDMLLHLC